MKNRFFLFLCTVFLFSVQSWGQTWNLTPTMTATLDDNGVLTISTTASGGEAMPAYHLLPWYNKSNIILSIVSVVIKDGITTIGDQTFMWCSNLTSVTIPNSVTNIGQNAFRLCSSLTSVSIPNSITTISRNAFMSCYNLTSVSIPNSVTIIEMTAFFECSSLASITIPKSVETIETQCFDLCESLKDVTVEWDTPINLTASVFFHTDISSATLHVPAGTGPLYRAADTWRNFGTIDDGSGAVGAIYHPGDIAVMNAMIDNNGLQWTKAPTDGSSVPGDWTYWNIQGVGEFGVIWSNEATNKRITQLYLSNQSLTGELNVTGLTELTFLWCFTNYLTSLDASGLRYLWRLGCGENNLSSLNVSGATGLWELRCWYNNLTSLDVSGLTNLEFLYCSYNSLTSLNVSSLTNLRIFYCDRNNLTSLDVSGLKNLQTIGCTENNLTSLDVSGLTNLIWLMCEDNNLTSLNVSGLRNLENLICSRNSLTFIDLTGINSSVYFLGYGQICPLEFTSSAGNYSANITFGAGATFDNSALSYNNGVLTSTSKTATSSKFISLTVQEGMELSGTLTMTYPYSPPVSDCDNPIASGSFGENDALSWKLCPDCTLCPDYTLTISGEGAMPDYEYDSSKPWDSYLSQIAAIVIEEGITSIGDRTFEGCNGFTGNLIIPNSVTSIGGAAFYHCSGFTGNLIIPNSVTSIGSLAFSDCSGFTGDLIIPNSVTTIGDMAFWGCSGFTGDLIIPNSITRIGTSTFIECSGLSGVIIPNSVTSIGPNAFWGCVNLQSVSVQWATPLTVPNTIFSNVPISDLILTVPAGTKALYQADPVWGTFGTIVEQEAKLEEESPVGDDGTGKMALSLLVPANTLFSGSFRLELPNGMHLDVSQTRLVADLASQLMLGIVQNADGSWLFTITPLNLRSATDLVYSRIVEMVYTVDETVTEGTHEARISDLLFEFDDGSRIVEASLPVTITVNPSTGILGLGAETFAYLSKDRLYVQSPAAETVRVYAASGRLLYSFQKPAGKASYSIDRSTGAVWIVKGSSGWVKKVIMN